MALDSSVSSHIPDWYPDPRGEAPLRYWDGDGWTDHIAPLDLSRQLDEAKAHRPWYRKKRILVPAGVALVVALFAGLGQVPADAPADHGHAAVTATR